MSNKTKNSRVRLRHWFQISAMAAAIGSAPASYGASFYLLEQSPAHLGHAFAGTASNINDASTVYFNPAGMAQLDGKQLTAGLNAVMPRARFRDEGSNTGNLRARTSESAIVPNLYYTHRMNDQWAFGLGLTVPFGLSSDYGTQWPGRYLATFSELELISLSATAAYSFNEKFSFGLGVSYQEMDVTLESQIDSTLGAAPNPETDSYGTISGDADDIVFDLSALYRHNEATTFGLAWREGGTFDLSGDAHFTRNALCAPGAGFPIPETNFTTGTLCTAALASREGAVRADVTLPDVLTLSASHHLDDFWSVHADIGWTRWSSIQYVDVVNQQTSTLVETLALQYSDTYRLALGATYRTNGPWTFRAGVAFDEAPQTDATRMTPRIPDEDRTWLSLGFNYAHSDNLSIDAGYAHLIVAGADIASLDTETGHNVVGSFSSRVDILSAQLNWKL